MEKVYIDLWWNLTFEHYQATPDWIPTPDQFAANWVNAVTAEKVSPSGPKQTFKQLVRQRRLKLLSALQAELVALLPPLCRGLPGTPAEHVAAALDPIYKEEDPHALPCVQILAGLDAAIAFELTRKVKSNDMLDYLHAAQALPYCDAFFGDMFMANKMRQMPLDFEKIYGTEIGLRPEEILAYLKRLS